MSNQMPFVAQDILDAMMQAAFSPRAEPFVQTDMDGHDRVTWQPTESLISPLMNVLRKYVEEDEEFQQLLLASIKARMPEIVDGLVAKVTGGNSAFGVAKRESGYSRPPTYTLADWLTGPLGEALSEALTPALVEHYNGEDGKPNFGNASLEVNVVVKP